jgi:hypothetical protein
MIIAIVIAAVGVGLVLVGLKGFSDEGIPLSSTSNLKGKTGRIVGIICLIAGSPIAIAGFWMMVKIAQMPARR